MTDNKDNSDVADIDSSNDYRDLFKKYPALHDMYLELLCNVPLDDKLLDFIDNVFLTLQSRLNFDPGDYQGATPDDLTNAIKPEYIYLCKHLLTVDKSVIDKFVKSGLLDLNGIYKEITGDDSNPDDIQKAITNLGEERGISALINPVPGSPGLGI